MDESILKTDHVELREPCETTPDAPAPPALISDPSIRQADAPIPAEDAVRSQAPFIVQMAAAVIGSSLFPGLIFAIGPLTLQLLQIMAPGIEYELYSQQQSFFGSCLLLEINAVMFGLYSFSIFACCTRFKVRAPLALILGLSCSFILPSLGGSLQDLGSIAYYPPGCLLGERPYLWGQEYLIGMAGAVSAMVAVLIVNLRYSIRHAPVSRE